METAPLPGPDKTESGVGPMAAIIIVVILLALGGIYFFITQEMKLHQTPSTGQEQANS